MAFFYPFLVFPSFFFFFAFVLYLYCIKEPCAYFHVPPCNVICRLLFYFSRWTLFFLLFLLYLLFILLYIESASNLVEGHYGHSSAKLIYGVFNTPTNSIPGSAVCAFSLQVSGMYYFASFCVCFVFYTEFADRQSDRQTDRQTLVSMNPYEFLLRSNPIKKFSKKKNGKEN